MEKQLEIKTDSGHILILEHPYISPFIKFEVNNDSELMVFNTRDGKLLETYKIPKYHKWKFINYLTSISDDDSSMMIPVLKNGFYRNYLGTIYGNEKTELPSPTESFRTLVDAHHKIVNGYNNKLTDCIVLFSPNI